jgi:hypothetical protein
VSTRPPGWVEPEGGLVQGNLDDTVFTEAWLEQAYFEVTAALEAGAGVKLSEPVPMVVLSAEDALQRRREYSERLAEHEGLTYGMDLMADLFYGDDIRGRYFPDEKAFYIFAENFHADGFHNAEKAREEFWGVMAHELVHAHDDQSYDVVPTMDVIIDQLADPSKMGEINAMMALLEGRATYAAELACKHAGVKPLYMPTMEQVKRARPVDLGDDAAAAAGAGVLNAISRVKLAQYVYGRDFAQAAHEFGGEKFFGEVFGSLPLSMAEIQDFERFKLRWAEDLAARLDAEEAEEAEEDGEAEGTATP